jgi:hypothetical protein
MLFYLCVPLYQWVVNLSPVFISYEIYDWVRIFMNGYGFQKYWIYKWEVFWKSQRFVFSEIICYKIQNGFETIYGITQLQIYLSGIEVIKKQFGQDKKTVKTCAFTMLLNAL